MRFAKLAKSFVFFSPNGKPFLAQLAIGSASLDYCIKNCFITVNKNNYDFYYDSLIIIMISLKLLPQMVQPIVNPVHLCLFVYVVYIVGEGKVFINNSTKIKLRISPRKKL